MVNPYKSSLKFQIVVYMITTLIISMLLTSVIVGYRYFVLSRERAIEDAKSSLRAVSHHIASALDFNDKVEVDKSLLLLGKVKEFKEARVVLRDGSLYSRKAFIKTDEKFSEIKNNLVSIQVEVVHENGEMLGFLEADITLEYVIQQGKKYILTLCLIDGLTLIVTSVIIFFLISLAMRPIESLKKSIEEISKRGFIGNVEVVSEDEVGDLAKAFNKMADTLQSTTVSRNYVDNILQSMLDMLFVLEPDGAIKTVNKAAQDMLGYREDELVGQDMSLMFIEEKQAGGLIGAHSFQSLIKKDLIINYEAQLRTNSGGRIPVLLSGAIMHNENMEMTGIVVAAKDITERKLVEEKLYLQSNAMIASASPIVITDLEGTIEWVNPAFSKMTGYTSEEVLGKSTSIFKSGKHKEEFYHDLWDTIKSGGIWSGEVVNRRKDGTFYTENMTITPVKNKRGEINHFVAIKLDTTESKRAEQEQEKLRQQLQRSQKLESIGTMANGIAHNFNNILGSIRGLVDMAIMDLPPESRTTSDLKVAIKSIEDAKELINKMLIFSRKEEQPLKSMKIHVVIEEALQLFTASMTHPVKVIKQINDQCRPVLADPNDIKQIVMNLCTNAYHALEGKSEMIAVGLDETVVDDSTAMQYPNLRAGRYALLTVSDTGKGMDQATMDRIFEPFFTTKEVGKGTGLGLSVTHGVVMSHHGEIMVNSLPGKGTTFNVYLPLAESNIN